MKILIIDDDIEVIETLTMFFRSLGHEIDALHDGSQCLDNVRAGRPDFVLLDVVLPDKSGLTLLKEIKEIDKELPVCMITGYKDIDHVIDAFRLGALDCLLKPFHYDYIKNILLPLVKTK